MMDDKRTAQSQQRWTCMRRHTAGKADAIRESARLSGADLEAEIKDLWGASQVRFGPGESGFCVKAVSV